MALLWSPSRAPIRLFPTIFTFQFEIIFLFQRLRHLIQIKYWYLMRANIWAGSHLVRFLLYVDWLLITLNKFLKKRDADRCTTICFIDLIRILLNIFMSWGKLFDLFWALDFSVLWVLPWGLFEHRYLDFTLLFGGVPIGIDNPICESGQLLVERLSFGVQIEISFLWLHLLYIELIGVQFLLQNVFRILWINCVGALIRDFALMHNILCSSVHMYVHFIIQSRRKLVGATSSGFGVVRLQLGSGSAAVLVQGQFTLGSRFLFIFEETTQLQQRVTVTAWRYLVVI